MKPSESTTTASCLFQSKIHLITNPSHANDWPSLAVQPGTSVSSWPSFCVVPARSSFFILSRHLRSFSHPISKAISCWLKLAGNVDECVAGMSHIKIDIYSYFKILFFRQKKGKNLFLKTHTHPRRGSLPKRKAPSQLTSSLLFYFPLVAYAYWKFLVSFVLLRKW